MGFELYFAGSLNKDTEQYLKEAGCNRLASQLNDKNVIADWCSMTDRPGHLFIDSGAFSAHTIGSEVDVDAYITYLNSIDEQVEIFAQVDKIPGEFRKIKTALQCQEAPELSWNNYLYMRSKVNSPDKLLPIFHQNEDFKWLKQILEWRSPEGNLIPYIGISPANDKSPKEKQAWMDSVFQIIRDSSNPKVKTHAFGMTSLRLLEMYPFYSADSTTWIMVGANGSIMSEYGILVLSEKQMNSPNHICHLPKDKLEHLEKYVISKGFTLEGMYTRYQDRISFNIRYLKDWADNYKYIGTDKYKKSLF